MRGTPRILRYICVTRICKNAQVRTIRREGRLKTSEPSETARRAPTQGASDDDTVHASWRHGEHVNKVSVGEPADGSPPKNAIKRRRPWQGRGPLLPDRERLIHSFFWTPH